MLQPNEVFHHDLHEAIRLRAAEVGRNEHASVLLERALGGEEGKRTATGAIAVETSPHTGRSPKDKHIVRDAVTRDRVWWENTAAMAPDTFEQLLADMLVYVEGRRLYAQSLRAAPASQLAFGLEVVTETAWHALFIRNLLRPSAGAARATVLHLPSFRASPARHGTRGSVVIALDMRRNLVLIGGTAYAGEIKKAVFSLFNFHAPAAGVLPMHCAANVGPRGDTALFFGLSGTGKTTLSSADGRLLIGDDEHGWASDGSVFNLESGCYAKSARLSAAAEPAIHAASLLPTSVLENVAIGADGQPDFDDLSVTENGRIAYPLSSLENVSPAGIGRPPANIIFLSADAFGVLPPIARLSPEEALYYFLAGYTARLAGTENGVVAPQATFSPCFGAPFMALHPTVYTRLLKERLDATGAQCWLVNTGWTGGAFGVGERMPIAVTRRLVEAALSGELADPPFRRDDGFGLDVPVTVEGVDQNLLAPRMTWPDPAAYDAQARSLRTMFENHLARIGGSTLTAVAAE
jgi:phosphoenolpyruvate carboxykinase (ATP)